MTANQTVDTNANIARISVADMCKYIALNLGGKHNVLTDSHEVMVVNPVFDTYVSITASNEGGRRKGADLTLESGSNRDKLIISKRLLLGLEYLYVSWDTPRQITFCYFHEGRFGIINITGDTAVVGIDGVEKRDKPGLQDKDQATGIRRTYYLISDIPEADEEPVKEKKLLDDDEDLFESADVTV